MQPSHGLTKVRLYKKGQKDGDVVWEFISEEWGKIEGPAILLREKKIQVDRVSIGGKERDIVRCECDIKGKMILSDPNTLPLYRKPYASRKTKTSTDATE